MTVTLAISFDILFLMVELYELNSVVDSYHKNLLMAKLPERKMLDKEGIANSRVVYITNMITGSIFIYITLPLELNYIGITSLAYLPVFLVTSYFMLVACKIVSSPVDNLFDKFYLKRYSKYLSKKRAHLNHLLKMKETKFKNKRK